MGRVHKEAAAQYRRERHDRLKAQGVCITCGSNQAVSKQSRCDKCQAKHNKVTQASHAKLKQEVFEHYGGNRCACCGEVKDIKFLHIDHKNGGGNAHRRAIGGHSGGKFYRWLKKNGFPVGYQVLCADCNTVKGYYGECPHSVERTRLLEAVATLTLTY